MKNNKDKEPLGKLVCPDCGEVYKIGGTERPITENIDDSYDLICTACGAKKQKTKWNVEIAYAMYKV